jgi:hypothetical protein
VDQPESFERLVPRHPTGHPAEAAEYRRMPPSRADAADGVRLALI